MTTGHIKVLLLLKDEIIQNKIDINERVLRAFKDVCTSTAIEHEESIFHNSVFEINGLFEKEILKYKNLELLRMDFGKGNPI